MDFNKHEEWWSGLSIGEIAHKATSFMKRYNQLIPAVKTKQPIKPTGKKRDFGKEVKTDQMKDCAKFYDVDKIAEEIETCNEVKALMTK